MLFAASGYNVSIYDVDPNQVESALATILVQLKELEKSGLLRGKLSVEEQHQLISGANSLSECLKGTKYVQVNNTRPSLFKHCLLVPPLKWFLIWLQWMYCGCIGAALDALRLHWMYCGCIGCIAAALDALQLHWMH